MHPHNNFVSLTLCFGLPVHTPRAIIQSGVDDVFQSRVLASLQGGCALFKLFLLGEFGVVVLNGKN